MCCLHLIFAQQSMVFSKSSLSTRETGPLHLSSRNVSGDIWLWEWSCSMSLSHFTSFSLPLPQLQVKRRRWMEGLFSHIQSLRRRHQQPQAGIQILCSKCISLRESKNWMVLRLWNSLFWFHTQFLYRQALKRIKKKEKESLTFPWPIRSKTLDKTFALSLLSVSSFLCSGHIENVSFPIFLCILHCSIGHSLSRHTVNSHLLMAMKPLKGSWKQSSLIVVETSNEIWFNLCGLDG